MKADLNFNSNWIQIIFVKRSEYWDHVDKVVYLTTGTSPGKLKEELKLFYVCQTFVNGARVSCTSLTDHATAVWKHKRNDYFSFGPKQISKVGHCVIIPFYFF